MKTIEEIIKALRCTSMPRHKYDCENCPYRELNEVNDDIPLKEDIIIDGKNTGKTAILIKLQSTLQICWREYGRF